MRKNIFGLILFISLSFTQTSYSKNPIVSLNNSNNNEKREPAPIFPFTNPNVQNFDNVHRDSNGIPMLLYDNKYEYYPIQYIQVALFYYANYIKTKDETSKETFLKIVDFAKRHMVYIDDFAVLQYNFIVNPYQINPPCQSSMAQSFGIGIMIQAYSITHDKSYLTIAEKMVKSFDVLIENGGVKSMWEDTPFYEEYPDPNSHVLNGYIFSLSGLYYAYKTTGNLEAKRLFDIGISSLKVKINQYDAAFTSYYSKLVGEQPAFASAINEDPDHYHELEIYQLLTLYIWTNESIFKEYAHKFLKYDTGEVTDFFNHKKFSSITATNTIDPVNFGVSNLDNELWSWGNYWSTNQFPTELGINFSLINNEKFKKNIEAITFYAISENTLPNNFEVYVLDENNNWNKVCDAYQMKIRNRNYYKTDDFETFIETYYFTKPQNGSALKINFLDARGLDILDQGIIALREINIQYDRSQELEIIENNARKSNPFK